MQLGMMNLNPRCVFGHTLIFCLAQRRHDFNFLVNAVAFLDSSSGKGDLFLEPFVPQPEVFDFIRLLVGELFFFRLP